MKRAEASPDLTAKEQAFVDALLTERVDGTWLTLTDAALEAGYNAQYGKQLRHRPKIAQAIASRIAELEAEHAETTQAILKRLGRDAQNGDKGAAALFLRAVGRGNTTNVVTTVTQVNTTPLPDKLREIHERRFAAVAIPEDA